MEADQRTPPTCSHCGRVIEECAFCGEPECAQALCHRCLVYDLHESTPHPHPHGG